jgi:hypothetical protein
MGGPGSSRWNGHQPAPLVEESLKIDLLSPEMRWALRQPEAALATTTFTVRGRVLWEWLLCFLPAGEDGSRELLLLPTNDTQGGLQAFQLKAAQVGFNERTYAVCPRCRKTTRILLALPDKGIFACKRCLGVQYLSVRKHDTRVDRIVRRLRAGDVSVVDEYNALGRRGGYRGFVADRLFLDAMWRAFPEA